MEVKLDLHSNWFMDPRLSGRELRLLCLMVAVRQQAKCDEVCVTREWICEELKWGNPVSVSQVSASLVAKGWMKKVRVGAVTSYTIEHKNGRSEGVSDHLPLAITNRKQSLTLTPSYIKDKKKIIVATSATPTSPPPVSSKSKPRRTRPTAQEIMDSVTMPEALITLEGYQDMFASLVDIKQSSAAQCWKTLAGPQTYLKVAAKELAKQTDVLAAIEAHVSNGWTGTWYESFRPKTGNGIGLYPKSGYTRRGDEQDVVDSHFGDSHATTPNIKEVN